MPSKAYLILRGAEHQSFALRRRVSKDAQWSCKAVVPGPSAFRVPGDLPRLPQPPSRPLQEYQFFGQPPERDLKT